MQIIKSNTNSSLGLIVLIMVQAVCALVFLLDVVRDVLDQGIFALYNDHLLFEALASVSLLVSIALETRLLRRLLQRQGRVERALSAASGALTELIEEYFADWGLTPSEEDVAAFTLKGFSIAEIAQFRGSRDGTIKAHLNAIYRKAGVAGRGQLVSILTEDLMRGALTDRDKTGETTPLKD